MASRSFATISPVDGSVYLLRKLATPEEIDQKLNLAASAQMDWQKTSLKNRARVCRAAVSYLVDHAEKLGKELSWQMGRPIRYTPAEITGSFQERALHMIDTAEKALMDLTLEETAEFSRFITREPVGTVLVLSPWNYPYLTSVNAVIPAIMAGNTVILKHAQQTPLTAERYNEAFAATNAPDGIFQFIHADHGQVAEMIKDPRINAVSFTGSVRGGEAIQEAASKRFIPVGLELGGKDPAYVRPDADFDATIANLVDGAFFNSGQSCCGIERIYVHEKLYDSFLDAFIKSTSEYQLGNPLHEGTTLGPMVSREAAHAARSTIQKAIREGAKTCVDASQFVADNANTAYLAPQVLVNVHHKMEFMQEETFAPVVGIMPVKNDHEAINLMNDSRYGLSASIWSGDTEAAQQIGKMINTGTVYMNRCDYLDPALAWTGVKNSGRGCTLSELGFQAFTRPKSFHYRKKL